MKKYGVVMFVGFLLSVSVLVFAGESIDMGMGGPHSLGTLHRDPPGGPQPMAGPPPMMSPHPMDGPPLCDKLNLSTEQMDKMWQLEEKLRSDTGTMRYEVFKREMELKKLYTDPKVEDAIILAKQKELSAVREKVDMKMMEFMLAQKKILTAEQLKKAHFPMGMPMR
jgi:Spy/CpxP family protein refolding chaperone